MYSVTVFYKLLSTIAVLLVVGNKFGRPLKIRPPKEPDPNNDFEIVSSHIVTRYPIFTDYVPEVSVVIVETEIHHRYARTKIMSTIMNSDKGNSHAMNFSLTIPSEAFISNFEMKLDEAVYISNITTNEQAKREYTVSRNEGRSITFAVLEQGKSSNVFRFNAIIGADKTVRFRLTYEELLIRNEDKYEYIVNFRPEKLNIVAGNFRVRIIIEESQKIKVNVPELHREFSSGVSKDSKDRKDKPKVRCNKPSRCVIDWNNSDGTQFEDQFVVHYSIEDEPLSGEILIRNGHFVHFFAPKNMTPLLKHVVFVLDLSDSMTGIKREQLQTAMLEILDDLKPEDYFNIVKFSGDTEVWSNHHGRKLRHLFPYPANAEYKESAMHFIKTKLQPSGSTNIHAGLVKALEICHNVSSLRGKEKSLNTISMYRRNERFLKSTLPENVESIIIFLTDGDATSGIIDHTVILRSVKLMNRNPFAPIYTLAFGEHANYSFLKELSRQNGAFSRKIIEHSDADIQVADFYESISSPVMSNVTFKYTSQNPGFSYKLETFNRNHLLSKGKEIISIGRFFGPNVSVENISATIGGMSRFGSVIFKKIVKAVCVPSFGRGICSSSGKQTPDQLFTERLMAYLTMKKHLAIKDLLVLPQSTYKYLTLESCETLFPNENEEIVEDEIIEDDSTSASYNEMLKPCEYLRSKEKIMDIALKYKFVTPFTSLTMRTKPIAGSNRETVSLAPNTNEAWEWFLGSEIPAPESAKIAVISVKAGESKGKIEDYEAIFKRPPQRLQNALNTSSISITSISNSSIVATTPTPTLNSASQQLGLYQLISSIMKQREALSFDRLWLLHFAVMANFVKITVKNSNLTLDNITWKHEILNDEISISEMKSNLTMTYQVATNFEDISSSLGATSLQLQVCTSPSKEYGLCKHLKDCVQYEFIDDFQLFKTSFLCPFRTPSKSYLGTCCPAKLLTFQRY